MGRMKLDKPHRLALLTAAVLVLACICMLVGAAWARYRYRETTDMLFSQKTAPQVYLWGLPGADGAYTPIPTDLSAGENGQTLRFVLANGESAEKFSAEDQYAFVRLYGSLGLGAGENLTAVLTVEGTEYTAVARKVDVDSPIHTSFGEGWIYCFMDADGKELRWLLEGEKLSHKEMQLTINTQTGLDTSLLRLLAASQTH